MYLLYPGMDKIEAINFPTFIMSLIIQAVHKEMNNCDICQHTKWSNNKNGKLPAKEVEGVPQKKSL